MAIKSHPSPSILISALSWACGSMRNPVCGFSEMLGTGIISETCPPTPAMKPHTSSGAPDKTNCLIASTWPLDIESDSGGDLDILCLHPQQHQRCVILKQSASVR